MFERIMSTMISREDWPMAGMGFAGSVDKRCLASMENVAEEVIFGSFI